MIDWTKLTPDVIVDACQTVDLDKALKQVFDVIDPDDTGVLGDAAAAWFTEPMDYIAPMDNGRTRAPPREAWGYLYEAERAFHLAAFFKFQRRLAAA